MRLRAGWVLKGASNSQYGELLGIKKKYKYAPREGGLELTPGIAFERFTPITAPPTKG